MNEFRFSFSPICSPPRVLIKADHWLVKPPKLPYYTFISIAVPLSPRICVDDSLEIRGNNPPVLAESAGLSLLKKLIYPLNRSFYLRGLLLIMKNYCEGALRGVMGIYGYMLNFFSIIAPPRQVSSV